QNINRSLGMVAEDANEPLTDADIPDSLTASNYLPLSGGALTGTLIGTDLTLSGTLTAGTLAVGGLSSGGVIEVPYITATSTSATSTLPNLSFTNLGTPFTVGSIPFVGTGGVLNQNNSNLFWDNANG